MLAPSWARAAPPALQAASAAAYVSRWSALLAFVAARVTAYTCLGPRMSMGPLQHSATFCPTIATSPHLPPGAKPRAAAQRLPGRHRPPCAAARVGIARRRHRGLAPSGEKGRAGAQQVVGARRCARGAWQLRSACSSARGPPTQIRMSPIWSGAAHSVPCHPSGPRFVGPIPPAPIREPPIWVVQAPAQIRVPPIQPGAFPFARKKSYWFKVVQYSIWQQQARGNELQVPNRRGGYGGPHGPTRWSLLRGLPDLHNGSWLAQCDLPEPRERCQRGRRGGRRRRRLLRRNQQLSSRRTPPAPGAGSHTFATAISANACFCP